MSATPPAIRRAVAASARLAPVPVEPEADLRRALRFLGSDLTAETVSRAGYGLAVPIVGVGLLGALVVPPRWRPAWLLLAVACAIGATYAVPAVPLGLARLRRSVALGAAPALVGRAVLRLSITPTVESATAFAASHGTDPLSRSLAAHRRRARLTGEPPLSGFRREWRPWFPALDRSLGLLPVATDLPPARRERLCDRALELVLEGTRDRLRSFATASRGPVTALYAFGVLVPLALVGIVPAASVAGISVSAPLLVVGYGVVLPGGVAAAGCWLVLRRPVAFPPRPVPVDHPDRPSRRWPRLVGAAAAGTVAGIVGWLVVGPWFGPLAGGGTTVGLGLYASYRPVERIREEARAVETGIPDALSFVGRQVADGTGVEHAIARCGERFDGPTGRVFADAERTARRLGIGVEAAFCGPHGAARGLPSERLHASAALLAIAGREGEPAGEALLAVATHLSTLERVERESRHELGRVTGSLHSTASVFGPLVGGVTVALAAGLDEFAAESAGVSTLSPSLVGGVVGWYVLVLAVVLTATATGLERGFDRAGTAYRIGRALTAAVLVFGAATVGASLLI